MVCIQSKEDVRKEKIKKYFHGRVLLFSCVVASVVWSFSCLNRCVDWFDELIMIVGALGIMVIPFFGRYLVMES